MQRANLHPQTGPDGRRAAAGSLLRARFRRQSAVLVALVVLVLLVATPSPLIEVPELNAISLAFQLRGARAPSSPLVIVAIDDITFEINNLQWPWPRTYFAQILDQLVAGGARVIAFDVFFFDSEAVGASATYTVRGESLAEIAARFEVGLAELVGANDLADTGRLCHGQVLTIPTNPPQQHAVVRERVEEIAARFQVDVNAVMALNDIAHPCELQPGRLLRLPAASSVDYVVQPGDTVRRIAGLFQVNALAVVDAQGQPARDHLTPGEVVTVRLGDAALAASIQAAGNVVLNGQKLERVEAGSRIESLGAPLTALRQAAAGFGLSNIGTDVNGAVHRIQAWNTASGEVYYSWPVVAASLYSGQALGVPKADQVMLGGQRVPLEGGFVRLNYLGPKETIPTYSALQVTNGDLFKQDPDVFRDKIVFIGATAESLKDTFATPFSFAEPTPGVEIMGNALETVLSQRYLYRPPPFVSLLSVLSTGLMALGLTFIRRPGLAALTLIGLMAAGVGVWLIAFLVFNLEIPIVAPETMLFVGFVVPSLERAISEELEKRRVRGIFELFISPEMVGQLIDQGIEAMRGQRAELTILFSDIRGFTTMSEKMTPEELVNLLNEYLGAMTEVIHRNGGTVDKYEGDLVMAFFGAPIAYPDHAQRAVRTAIEMRQELDRLRAKWELEGKPSRLEMGIGLNTGEVFVGLVGSGKRVNYTVMGDAVNLASRLQDLTKELQWPLLISDNTYDRVQDSFDAEFGESRLVKGKTVPVGIYRVLGAKGAPEAERVRALYA